MFHRTIHSAGSKTSSGRICPLTRQLRNKCCSAVLSNMTVLCSSYTDAMRSPCLFIKADISAATMYYCCLNIRSHAWPGSSKRQQLSGLVRHRLSLLIQISIYVLSLAQLEKFTYNIMSMQLPCRVTCILHIQCQLSLRVYPAWPYTWTRAN